MVTASQNKSQLLVMIVTIPMVASTGHGESPSTRDRAAKVVAASEIRGCAIEQSRME
jgi:hypothetical protein